jgi:transposase InsO family protein
MKKQEEQKRRRSQRDYSLAFKLQVVSEVEKGELSYKQAQRKYGILKHEFLIKDGFNNHLEAVDVIKESIDIYNNERPHSSCSLLTPNQTHLQQKLTIKKWKKKTSKVLPPEV